MPKFTTPSYEPLPYYMSAIGMQGARFLEGNYGSGAGPDGGIGTAGAAEDGEGAPDEKLGEPGKRALEAERTARKNAEKELKKLQDAETAREREQMGEAERLKAELADERAKSAKLEVETAVRGLLIDHKLEASDGPLLSAVADPAQRELLAKRLAKAPGKPDGEHDSKEKPGSKSGTGGDTSGAGSIAEYRREIAEKRAL